MSRRNFLKIAGASSIGVLLASPKLEVLADKPKDLPSGLTLNKKLGMRIFGGGDGGEVGIPYPPAGLPETEKSTRSWFKLETKLKPPESIRSAICWSKSLNGFLLHGGWVYDTSHNETWLFKGNEWTQIEEGSTPSLHGHKISETPLGVVMYGGSFKEGEIYKESNQFYLFNQKKNVWENLTVKWEDSLRPPPALNGSGMVYNPKTRSVWIIGGGYSNDIGKFMPSDGITELFLPGAWDSENWYLKQTGNLNWANFYISLFEPLAYCIPNDPATYLYGGQGPDGLGNVLPSTISFKISKSITGLQIESSSLPGIDYGGTLRGGYDPLRKELLLHSGEPHDFWSSPYRETLAIGEDNIWYQVKSSPNPPVCNMPAVAVDTAGKMIRFGGAHYDGQNRPVYLNETWMLLPSAKIYLPELDL